MALAGAPDYAPPPDPALSNKGGAAPGAWQTALANALRGRGQYGALNAPAAQTAPTWSAPQAIGRGGNPWRAPMITGGVPPTMSAQNRYGAPTSPLQPQPGDANYQPLVGPQKYTGPGAYQPPPPPPPPPPDPPWVQDWSG